MQRCVNVLAAIYTYENGEVLNLESIILNKKALALLS